MSRSRVNARGAIRASAPTTVILSAHIVAGRQPSRSDVCSAGCSPVRPQRSWGAPGRPPVLSRADTIIADAAVERTLVERLIGSTEQFASSFPAWTSSRSGRATWPTPRSWRLSTRRIYRTTTLIRAMALVTLVFRCESPVVGGCWLSQASRRRARPRIGNHIHSSTTDQRDAIWAGQRLRHAEATSRTGVGEGFGIVYLEAGRRASPDRRRKRRQRSRRSSTVRPGLLVDPESPRRGQCAVRAPAGSGTCATYGTGGLGARSLSGAHSFRSRSSEL
jgi:hypothetical protein